MFREFLSLRANVVIAFLGAFAIMFLIKLTSILPAQYYFSFSELFGGDDTPFLIDPPGVSNKKFCDILRKNNINVRDIKRDRVECNERPQSSEVFDQTQKDAIYTIALQNDPVTRQRLMNAMQNVTLAPLSDEQIFKITERYSTPKEAYEQIIRQYNRQLERRLGAYLFQQLQPAYGQIKVKDNNTQTSSVLRAKYNDSKLSPDQVTQIHEAHQLFMQRFSAQDFAARQVTPLQKSSLDKIIKDAYSKESLLRNIGNHYIATYKVPVEQKLKEVFAVKGLSIKPNDKPQKARAVVVKEILSGGLHNYVIAILVRILPVLLFGFVLGIVFGRKELFSISLAGALAAFFLSWPVILLWDTVVQSSWNDKKHMFLIFYALYIVSFFFTARVGAVLGAALRPIMPKFVKASTPDGDPRDITEAISMRTLSLNVFTGIAANAVVYAWNVMIPLTST